jgi:hypothetical protein
MKRLTAGLILSACLLLPHAASAQSRIPSLSSSWGELEIAQDQCTRKARQVMEQFRYRRIELVGATTFGDRTDYQIGIRCVADKRMYYIFGGGPDEPVIRRYIDELKAEFER